MSYWCKVENQTLCCAFGVPEVKKVTVCGLIEFIVFSWLGIALQEVFLRCEMCVVGLPCCVHVAVGRLTVVFLLVIIA